MGSRYWQLAAVVGVSDIPEEPMAEATEPDLEWGTPLEYWHMIQAQEAELADWFGLRPHPGNSQRWSD